MAEFLTDAAEATAPAPQQQDGRYRAGLLRAAEILFRKRESYLAGLNKEYRDRSTWQHGAEEAYRLGSEAIRAEAAAPNLTTPYVPVIVDHADETSEWMSEDLSVYQPKDAPSAETTGARRGG